MRERLSQLLYPVYQPIIDSNGNPVYWEAAVRTYGKRQDSKDTHKRLLAVAEEAGFVDEIDCTMAQLVLEATGTSSIPVGVNVSAFTVQSAIDAFLTVLRRRHRSQTLIVEVTETLQPDRMDLMDRFVAEVRRTGARLAIDDYGIGHFEPRDVETMRPDYLKLAMERVVALESIEGRRWISQAVALGESVGAAVIAEGVENDGVCGLLHSLGVRMYQGYLWGQPTHLLPRPRFALLQESLRNPSRGYVATPVG